MKIRIFIPVQPELPAASFKLETIDRFQGYTLFDAVGAWKMPDGTIADEPVQILEVLVGKDQRDAAQAWLEFQCMAYGLAANQDAVLYSLDDEPHFVYSRAA